MSSIALSTRMKSYEHVETLQRFDKTKPLYIRVDGRGFSKFTSGMAAADAATLSADTPSDAPSTTTPVEVPGFSLKFADAMKQTAQYLLTETRANFAFVQSDEISLVFNPVPEGSTTEIFFTGKKQKVVSTIASLATAKFLQIALEYWPERVKNRGLPTFDCRALSLPDEAEVINTLLFRCRDGTRNSISTVCRRFHSAKSLHGVNSQAMLTMIEAAGVKWEDIPRHFREGTFYQIVTRETGGTTASGPRQSVVEVIPDELFAPMPFEQKLAVVFGTKVVDIPESIQDIISPYLFTKEQVDFATKP